MNLPWIFHFEAAILSAVSEFAASTPSGVRVLDAGAGEGRYRDAFDRQRYVGVDLAVGDAAWDYSRLNALANLETLPFPDETFEAAINIVTLEHVASPQRVIDELARVLAPRGRLLLIVPQDWEVHQHPHDYFRYTRFGCRLLLERAGFAVESVEAVGGYFRLLARRLLLGHKLWPAPLNVVWLAMVAIPALILPLFDRLDRNRDTTLGYICIAYRPPR